MKLFKILKNGTCEAFQTSDSRALEKVLKSCRQMYASTGYKEPWVAYVAIKDNEIAGACAFKSAPQGGKVEIAYFTFPKFEGRGLASQMVEALMEMARAEDPNLTIIAQTLPEENASNSILKKFRFEFAGAVQNPNAQEVWEWRLPPPNGWHIN